MNDVAVDAPTDDSVSLLAKQLSRLHRDLNSLLMRDPSLRNPSNEVVKACSDLSNVLALMATGSSSVIGKKVLLEKNTQFEEGVYLLVVQIDHWHFHTGDLLAQTAKNHVWLLHSVLSGGLIAFSNSVFSLEQIDRQSAVIATYSAAKYRSLLKLRG